MSGSALTKNIFISPTKTFLLWHNREFYRACNCFLRERKNGSNYDELIRCGYIEKLKKILKKVVIFYKNIENEIYGPIFFFFS